MAEFRVGDQVEVRFTGTVITVAPSILAIKDEAGRIPTIDEKDEAGRILTIKDEKDEAGRYIYVRTNEQITLIEPAYEPGRAYRTSTGIYLLRGMDGKWRNCYGDTVTPSKDDRLEPVG